MTYTSITDLLIACHFWDPRSPVFMTREDMKRPDFRIRVIADVSCDINGPIPSTIRASTISDPFFGYDPVAESESDAFGPGNITVMAVDNLPGELPRDASEDFGNKLIQEVIPYLIGRKGRADHRKGSHRQGRTADGKFQLPGRFCQGHRMICRVISARYGCGIPECSDQECLNFRIVPAGSSVEKIELPMTNTSVPALIRGLMLSRFTPPSTSIRVFSLTIGDHSL